MLNHMSSQDIWNHSNSPRIKVDSFSFLSLYTLFQLLAPEIRRERNIIFQCIRHIANQNYYGIGSSKLESKSDSSKTATDSGRVPKDENGNEAVTSAQIPTNSYYDDDIWET